MSFNKEKKADSNNRMKKWAQHVGAVLVVLPLLLQPLGSPLSANPVQGGTTGSAGITGTTWDFVLKYPHPQFKVNLNQLFPNVTDANQLDISVDHSEVVQFNRLESSSTLYITPLGSGAATFTVTPKNGESRIPQTFKVTVIDPGSDQKIDIEDITKLVKRYPSAIQSGTDATKLLNAIEHRIINAKPEVTNTNPLYPLELGGTRSIPEAYIASDYFRDPDGDTLTLQAHSSAEHIAKAFVVDGMLQLEGIGVGEAIIYIQATDPAGGTTEAAIPLNVYSASDNKAPLLYQPLGDRVYSPTGTAGFMAINLSQYFYDPEGQPLTYTVESSQPAVADVLIEGNELHMYSKNSGTSKIFVTAWDPQGAMCLTSFDLTVPATNPEPPMNLPPVNEALIGAITFTPTGTAEYMSLDLSAYFRDPEQLPLTYSALSLDPLTFGVQVVGHELRMTRYGTGKSGVILVTAIDSVGQTVSQTFELTVPQAPINLPPVAQDVITEYYIESNGRVDIPLSTLFRDPENDPLTYIVPPYPTVEGYESRGASITRQGDVLKIHGDGFDTATSITISAYDALHPTTPATQQIRVHSIGGKNIEWDSSPLKGRILFANSQLEIDLNQKLDDESVTSSTYKYYLGSEGQTVTSRTYSNAHIDHNKLIINTNGSSKGVKEHYKVIAIYGDAITGRREVIDTFDIQVIDMDAAGTYLNLWRHLPEEAVYYIPSKVTYTGDFTPGSTLKVEDSTVQIDWNPNTQGSLTINTYPGQEPPFSSPAITYTIRFTPKPILLVLNQRQIWSDGEQEEAN